MVFRHISVDIKERALWLREQGYIDDEIAHLLGISTRSIQRWNQNFDAYGSVVAPYHVGRGRPSELDTKIREDLVTLAAESPELFLDEIQEWITIAHNVAISRSRLCEILQDCAISYKRLRRAAAERDEELISNWREAYQQAYTASQILWIDETSKDDRTIYRHYGRAISGQRAVIPANFVRGDRYSFVAALGIEGYAAIRVVPGSLDGGEFFDFVVDDVLPTMNPFPGDRSIIIMDNCRIHKSETLRELVESFGHHIVFLPPYSPHLNPIEESFSALKAYIRRHWKEAQNHNDPENFLLEAASVVTAENAQGWIKHAGYIL